jgi:hypothetical protein
LHLSVPLAELFSVASILWDVNTLQLC